MFQYRARSTEYEALFDSLGSSSEAGDPRSAIAFWVTRARGAEGGFSARFASRGGRQRLIEPCSGGFGRRLWHFRGVLRAAMPSTARARRDGS